jgi:hypothetical protein
MKPFIFSMIALGVFACGSKTESSTYGEKIDTVAAETVDVALKAFESSGKADAVIKGQISQVCTGEGCWYTLKHGIIEQFVGFEKFTIPKDVVGKNSIAAGVFYRDTTSVDALKTEAKEAGKPAAEIETIKEPIVSICFRAKGLIIK